MNYIELLKDTARKAGNCACLGIDPNFGALPEGLDVRQFFLELFEAMDKAGLKVAAIKPNIGYFSKLDRPLEGDFSGSRALADIVKALPARPFILDAKRGDIATSSANYAFEAFRCWGADCVTVSPYMGNDSISPFASAIGDGAADKGFYILNRTSNPGGKDLQNQVMQDGRPVYMHVADLIAKWNKEFSSGIGAVVGATNLVEFEQLSAFYSDKDVPLLIPGVGSQGGSAPDVIGIMRKTGYALELCRINSSSALTHPWAKRKEAAPANWKNVCIDAIRKFTEECSL
ncbi:MAG: orotidine-5'-phosphate decarboxylase [Spirochaetales bacterium]|nr:orotidine-5'-phosphate decarboxylase [Spirochaetales bacterium]